MTRVLLVAPYGFQNTGIRLLSAVLRQDGSCGRTASRRRSCS